MHELDVSDHAVDLAAVLVFAVERLLYVFLGVVELPAVEVQDGAGHVEQLIDW